MPRSIADETYWRSDQTLLAQLQGSAELESWFGFLPNFHDAAVRSMAFEAANGALILTTFRQTDKTDDQGYFVLDRYADVIFHFEDVRGVVFDCNPLSTILELGLRRVTAERLPILNTAAQLGDIELAFDEVCGGSGAIYARAVSVSVLPRSE